MYTIDAKVVLVERSRWHLPWVIRDLEFDVQLDSARCLSGLTESASTGKDVRRVTELFDNPHFFPVGGAANSNAIKQGALGDCWFLSALATVSCISGLIEKICVAVRIYSVASLERSMTD